MTLVFKETPDPEDFPACLACRDPPDHQDRRVTEVCRETGAHQEWAWKVLRVLRDLTDCQARLVLVRQDSKVYVVRLGSKVGESESERCDGMLCCSTTLQESQEYQEPGDTAVQPATLPLNTGGNSGGGETSRRRRRCCRQLEYDGADDRYCIL